jgi:tetratricopeptide (TPR) repeat protein
MNLSQKFPIALIGAVATMAIAQPTAVFAISAKVPSITVAAEPKAEDFFIQGHEKYEKGDYQGAVAAFTQAIMLNPNDAQAYYNRGIARSSLGDKQGEIADYNQALRINPNYAKAYYNRGVARSDLGDKQGAVADYDQAPAN